MRARRWLPALACLCLLHGLEARAACSVAAGSLSFGTYNPLSAAPVTTSATITVSCNQAPAPPVTVQIGPSTVSGGFSPRLMAQIGGGDSLAYNVYLDSGATVVWGDGTGGTGTQSGTVQKNHPWTLTVYGVMPGGQDVTPGAYADQLAVIILF